jgi:hypothetical protein
MNGFWRVFRRFRWLCLLFALLACLPPQITILAPVVPEAALSAYEGDPAWGFNRCLAS